MKNSRKISLFLFVFLLITAMAYSQNSIIEINNTNINVPETHDFGQFSERVFKKYIVKNNRNSAVTVSEIKIPAGFFANISEMNIAAGKKVILYIGIEPSIAEFEGDFEEKIIIKTNLITDIEVKVKGTFVK